MDTFLPETNFHRFPRDQRSEGSGGDGDLSLSWTELAVGLRLSSSSHKYEGGRRLRASIESGGRASDEASDVTATTTSEKLLLQMAKEISIIKQAALEVLVLFGLFFIIIFKQINK